MKILPVSINNNYPNPNFKGGSSAKKLNSEACSGGDNTPKLHVIKGGVSLFPKPLTKKEKAALILTDKVNKMADEYLSEDVREKHKTEVDTMKNSIVKGCITFDDYKGKEFDSDRAIEVFDDWHNYVTENNERLSHLMNAPYDIIQKERVSIDSYAKSHPDDSKAEILQSPLYKMYKLIELNKPSRTHFHD